jgi:hypothetical protein
MTLPNAQSASLQPDSRTKRHLRALLLACLCALPAFAALSPAVRAASPQPKPQGTDSQRAPYAPQQKAQPKAAPVPLLSSEQGREIAAAALALEDLSGGVQDCSHLVHRVYTDAGYDYPYASSFDLYAGVHGSFRRVRHAQAGDVVAWPGHVGIVLNPRQHSFYSLVRSGWQAEDYLAPYWRSRGTPRFYRYVVEGRSSVRTVKAAERVPPSSKSSVYRNNDGTTELRGQPERPVVKPATEEAALRTKVNAPTVESETEATEPAPTKISVSSTILVIAEQRRPTAEEVLEAISKRNDATAGVFRTQQPLNTKTPVVIFDDIRVEKIETKRDKGWAHLQIDSHVQIAGGGADFKRRHEKVKWELLRDASGWSTVAPTERNYVGRDAAIRALAGQLAEMAQSEAAAQHDETVIGQEARIANLLSALLEK